jgi:hypothetical protein
MIQKCGGAFFSDVYEYRKGGVDRLTKRMRHLTGANVTITTYNNVSVDQKYTFRPPLWLQSAIRRLSSTFVHTADDTRSLPHHHTSTVPKAGTHPTQKTPTPQRAMYLMACIHRTEHHINVVQDALENVATDRQLFGFLKMQLRQYRGRLPGLVSMRRVRKIFFVKVSLPRTYPYRDRKLSLSDSSDCAREASPRCVITATNAHSTTARASHLSLE